MSLNHVRLCLYRVGRRLTPGGRFFASYFHAPADHPLDASLNDGRRWTERNAFFYYERDLEWAARWSGLTVRHLGSWGHPSGQLMVEFRHAPEPRAGRRPPALERVLARLRRRG